MRRPKPQRSHMPKSSPVQRKVVVNRTSTRTLAITSRLNNRKEEERAGLGASSLGPTLNC